MVKFGYRVIKPQNWTGITIGIIGYICKVVKVVRVEKNFNIKKDNDGSETMSKGKHV